MVDNILGFTPRYAVQHEFSVVNKKELVKYMQAYEARQKQEDEAEEKRQEQAREDMQKF